MLVKHLLCQVNQKETAFSQNTTIRIAQKRKRDINYENRQDDSFNLCAKSIIPFKLFFGFQFPSIWPSPWKKCCPLKKCCLHGYSDEIQEYSDLEGKMPGCGNVADQAEKAQEAEQTLATNDLHTGCLSLARF